MIGRRKFIKNSSIISLAACLADPFSFMREESEQFIFQSDYLNIALDKTYLRFNHFSTDSLGKSQFKINPLFETEGVDAYVTKAKNNSISYYKKLQQQKPDWELVFTEKEISIKTFYNGNAIKPFLISFSQQLNHCTVLGHFAADKRIRFPCLLHFPGMGTFRAYCSEANTALIYEAELTDKPFVNIAFMPADEERPEIIYTLKSVTIYPAHPAIKNDRQYNGLKKNFINIFQLSPGFGLLANNSTSDACAFTLFLYAEMARKTPQLAEGLTAFDMVRDTTYKYLNGFIGYGMVGKPNWHSEYNSSDSFPSLIIAACYYALETKDYKWAEKNYAGITEWVNKMLATDTNGDGIVEYGYSGNAGSWDGKMRPANWWDTIGFGHDDAYSNALAYRSLVLIATLSRTLNKNEEAKNFYAAAEKLKSNYYKIFFNPETGVLAGWRSADGKLHDYYFTFVNSVAVVYGLLSKQQGKIVMTRLLQKMKEAGYTNFHLGLPGNLIPIRREDYTDHDRRWGYGKDEEGRDGFQIYENGGATGCYTYFTIQALKMLGMKAEADAILLPMLESFTRGDFEGHCPGSSYTKDWKTWKGECWGYEGFLVDNYLTFLAVVDE